MKRVITSLLCSIALLVSLHCIAPALTISAPGTYTVGWNVPYAPVAGEPIILIESSNVLLDLEGYTLDQINSETGVAGISIGNGFSNIVIKNGRIRNVTDCGLVITPTATFSEKISIENIFFENCGSEGIAIIPSGGFTTQNLSIEGCTFLDCARSSTSTAMLRISGSAPTVHDIKIFQRPTATPFPGSRTALYIENIRNGIFSDIRISGIRTAEDIIGIDTAGASGVEASLFEGIVISDLYTTSGNTTGISASACKNSAFNNCFITSSTGLINTGIILANQPQSNLFIGCLTEDLYGTTTARGFSIAGTQNAVFVDCVANRIGTSGASGTTDGFFLSTAIRCHALRCLATNGIAVGTNSQTAGFRIAGASTCSLSECLAVANNGIALGTGYVLTSSCIECSLMDCKAYSNGNTATIGSGFEVEVSGTGTNVFLRNAALRNGPTAGNQFRNFLATQRTTLARTGTNSTAQPWTNVAVT
jgi:hypothetical protein